MNMTADAKPRELKGRHVLAITVSAFAIIIGVNVYMASQAIKTFPGLEVKNSYVASQTFDEDRIAQEALGWDVKGHVDGDRFVMTINDIDGAPIEGVDIGGALGRPTSIKEDITPEFTFDGTQYVATTGVLPSGNWNFRMIATAPDGTLFKQRVVFYIRD